MRSVARVLALSLAVAALLAWGPLERGAGQAPAPMVFVATLATYEEAPAVQAATPATAAGSAAILFDPGTNRVTVSVAFTGLSARPNIGHFHRGAAGAPGPVWLTICGAPAPAAAGACPNATSGFITATATLPAALQRGVTPQAFISALMDGGLYLNFHTQLNPAGEIRGQVLGR
ncbi:MAG: CHRD domain-containing protein [Armatimonadetes bacterium]|nr:CHRD domain-containing protein [Armatimonadota bacterium]